MSGRSEAFARVVRAYRDNRDAPPILDRERREAWPPARRVADLAVSAARRGELSSLARILADSPDDVAGEIETGRGYRIDCLDSRLLLAFPRSRPELSRLATTRSLFAVVAAHGIDLDYWYTAYVVLTEPGREAGQVGGGVYATSGRQVATLEAQWGRAGYAFEVTGVRARGAFPLQLRGTFDEADGMMLERAAVAPSTMKLRVARKTFERVTPTGNDTEED